MSFNSPTYNMKYAQWSAPFPLPPDPPGGAPIRTNQPCAIRTVRDSESAPFLEGSGHIAELVISFPVNANGKYYSTFDFLQVYQNLPLTQYTVFEIPPASGQWFLCIHSRIVAAGFPNEHKQCFVWRVWKGGLQFGHEVPVDEPLSMDDN